MVKPLVIQETVDGELVSPALTPYLARANDELTTVPLRRTSVLAALTDLVEYLASPEGRTNANCVATDFFFALQFEMPDDVDLPDDIGGIVFDLGGALHDTFTAPHIAENFDSTPEQLLERLKTLE